jgi:hypothetical protein
LNTQDLITFAAFLISAIGILLSLNAKFQSKRTEKEWHLFLQEPYIIVSGHIGGTQSSAGREFAVSIINKGSGLALDVTYGIRQAGFEKTTNHLVSLSPQEIIGYNTELLSSNLKGKNDDHLQFEWNFPTKGITLWATYFDRYNNKYESTFSCDTQKNNRTILGKVKVK